MRDDGFDTMKGQVDVKAVYAEGGFDKNLHQAASWGTFAMMKASR